MLITLLLLLVPAAALDEAVPQSRVEDKLARQDATKAVEEQVLADPLGRGHVGLGGDQVNHLGQLVHEHDDRVVAPRGRAQLLRHGAP